MQILINVFHPNLEESIITKKLIEELVDYESITINNLYRNKDQNDENYAIDIAKEQILLSSHDKIIFQFPLYWYSCPWFMKKYIDEVFTYDWSYGNGKNALKDKELSFVITTGSAKESFSKNGKNKNQISTFLEPLKQMSNVLGMQYKNPLVIYQARKLTENEITKTIEEYKNYILVTNE